MTYKPTPQELFNQAGGDLMKYRELLIEHGMMVKITRPDAHPEKGAGDENNDSDRPGSHDDHGD